MALSPLRRIWTAVPLRSRVTGVDAETLRRWLADLPPPPGYAVSARPLRYRQAPHLAAFCWYEDRLIELQVPEPFRAWDERVYYRARRKPGRRLAFQPPGSVSHPARGAALRLLPRVLSLVPARGARRQGLGGNRL